MNYQRERHSLKKIIRSYFDPLEYLEVETPIAVVCPGTEQYLRYFETTWLDYNGLDRKLWLRSSPELHMKQLLTGGHDRIYQFATCFRNHGEFSEWHHPEFQMLEWYEKDLGFNDFIGQIEDFLTVTSADFSRINRLHPFKLPKVFTKFSVTELFKIFGIELTDLDPALPQKAKNAGVISITENDDFHSGFFKVLLEKIEPFLAQQKAAVVYDYPESQAALATVENGYAKRVEFYIDGIEISNGFQECLDYQENLNRYRSTMSFRKKIGLETPDEDDYFFSSLQLGLPPSCGNALGFDRWLALLLGLNNISSIIPFRNKNIYKINT